MRRAFLKVITVVGIILAVVPTWSGQKSQKKTVFISSPRYTVDIGFELTGKCDPYHGSNWKSLDLYSTFKSIRFVGTGSADPACWIESAEGGVALHQVQGHGEIREFSLCPAWESEDEPVAARVIRGPAPFAPGLAVLSHAEAVELLPDSDDLYPNMPIVPVVWLQYRTMFSVQGKELAWEHPKLSTNQIEDFSVVFPVPTGELAKGEPVSVQVPYSGEAEKGTWSITFSPLAEKKR